MPRAPAAQRKRDQRQRAVDAVANGEPLTEVSSAGLVDQLLRLVADQHARLPDVLIELGRRGGVALRRR